MIEEELKVLKDEFQHHQDKIDQYYDLLQTHKDSSSKNIFRPLHLRYGHFWVLKIASFQILNAALNVNLPVEGLQSYFLRIYIVILEIFRGKNRGLKDSYHNLHKLVARGAESKEFIEPKVAGLWRLAAAADFTQEELESLHVRLKIRAFLVICYRYTKRKIKVEYISRYPWLEETLGVET
ncbi:hypothetical protein HAZT_HAZT005997 [Hyalella azteca]|uniref:Alpha-2-macroglobulin RAP C-terminal domain-containing protein n=1 Tax=Hyalella azteca TaxID=294128 RepID=A0A6A0HG21_HYAAZ|nr:hypothetical protein HAZT_HAZT005997 [Hyalella azteca]